MRFLAFVVIIAVIVVVGRLMFVRSASASGKRISSKRKTTRQIDSTPYGASSIVVRENACDAVKKIEGLRYLHKTGITPKLPLPECTLTTCTCRYEKYTDRRKKNDRRKASLLDVESGSKNGKIERRDSGGRRRND